MAVREWKKGEMVFCQGDWGSTMYEIIDGKAGVYVDQGTPNEKKLTELTAGEMFGEMALIEVYARSATVVAEEDLLADEIDHETLNEYFRSKPEKIKAIMIHLSHRMRKLTNDYNDVCFSIYEVEKTKDKRESRSSGLLEKVKKFLGAAREPELKVKEDFEEQVLSIDPGEDVRGVSAVEHFRKGQTIFREGDEGQVMYYLAVGEVGIYLNYGKSGETQLTSFAAGNFFGEMGLIERLPRSATAVALSDTVELEVISEKDLSVMIEKCQSRAYMVMQHLSSRLRALTIDYTQACRTLAEVIRAEEEDREIEANFRAMQALYIAQAQTISNCI